MNVPSRAEAADLLRDQANACRRLALQTRTSRGFEALQTVAQQFDQDADKVDSPGLSVSSGDAAALVRVRLALESQAARRSRPYRTTNV